MNTPIALEQVSIEQVTIERVDDIPLLVALQQRVGIADVIDSIIPRHWLHQGLSIGQLVLGWNTFILSEGDHRKVTVRDWVIDHRGILEKLLGLSIRDTDFTDDRLGQVLTYLSDDKYWLQTEEALWQNSVSVYRLNPERVRLDSTTASGHHTVTDESLMQYGYNPQKTAQPQVKVMVGSVDIGTNGHLVATEIVSGQKADDPLYQPVLQQLRHTLQEPGLLYMGDSKMSSLAIRADIVAHGDFYLVPLAKVGEIPNLFDRLIEKVVAADQEVKANPALLATLIFDNERLLAYGYETTRLQNYTSPEGKKSTWEERLLVIRSQSDAKKELARLHKRLEEATQALLALTPEPGRGKRQIRKENQLIEKAEAIVQRFGVKEYLYHTFRRQEITKTQYVGRGRGGKNRPKRTIKKVRYQITGVNRDENAINAAYWRMGWRLYATNQKSVALPIDEAIRIYRQAPRIERHFHLLKDVPIGIEPLYVRRDDQIKGLVRLLSLCVRLLTLIEIVARRSLKQSEQKLSGLYEGNPKQQTNQPTAKRLLKTFCQISLLQFTVAGQSLVYITPLSPLQRQILSLLELSEAIYEVPFMNSG